MNILKTLSKKTRGASNIWTSVSIIAVVGLIAGGVIFWPKYKLEYQVNQTQKNIAQLRSGLNYLFTTTNPIVRDTNWAEPGNLRNTLLKYNAELAGLLPPDTATAYAKKHFYNSTTGSSLVVEGATDNYSMGVITIENISGKMCAPLMTNFYTQFDQIFAYSEAGGIGTCHNSIEPRKPSLATLLEACRTYQSDTSKIWMSFLMKNGPTGGCNSPY